MKILAIWGQDDAVFSKGIQSKKELKKMKHKGKKPNRLIIHERDLEVISAKQLKQYITHSGLIITTNGKCIYDGKRKKLI